MQTFLTSRRYLAENFQMPALFASDIVVSALFLVGWLPEGSARSEALSWLGVALAPVAAFWLIRLFLLPAAKIRPSGIWWRRPHAKSGQVAIEKIGDVRIIDRGRISYLVITIGESQAGNVVQVPIEIGSTSEETESQVRSILHLTQH